MELGREEAATFSAEAMEALDRYSWPGNIRELKNVVERAVYRTDSSLITGIVFDPFEVSSEGSRPPEQGTIAEASKKEGDFLAHFFDMPLRDAVRELEVQMIRRALERTRYNQRRAASMLDITYHQFRGLYRKYKDSGL